MKFSAKFILILVLALIVLSLPIFIRDKNNFIGEDNYFYTRIVGLFNENKGIPSYDSLSYSGRDFTYELGPIYLLVFLSKFFNLDSLLYILPILFGISTIILFYLILKKFEVQENEVILSLVLFIISPLMFYGFTSFNLISITLPLVLLTTYLFLQTKFQYKIFSFILLFLLSLFNYKALIIVFLFILFYSFKLKNIKSSIFPLILSLTSLSIFIFPKLLKFGSEKINLSSSYLGSLLSDIGGVYGITIFLLILSFFGLSFLWKEKQKHFYLYLLTIIVFILSIFDHYFIIYLELVIFYLASLGLSNLIKSTWDSELIRKLTITFLILGLVISSYGSFISLRNAQPTNELIQSLNELRDEKEGVVFSHYSYGVFINSIANKPNFIDKNSDYIKDAKKRNEDMQTLFYSRNADKSKEIIDRYNIKYILITREMKEGLVWKGNDEGLLFVIQNSKEFRKMTNLKDVEIWRVR